MSWVALFLKLSNKWVLKEFFFSKQKLKVVSSFVRSHVKGRFPLRLLTIAPILARNK